MELKKVNKRASFRILFDLHINHLTDRKKVEIKELIPFGHCFKYAFSASDINVEDILKKEIAENPNSLLDYLQMYENATFEMTGTFLCTAMFDKKTGQYIRCNWKLDNVHTYVLETEDLTQISSL